MLTILMITGTSTFACGADLSESFMTPPDSARPGKFDGILPVSGQRSTTWHKMRSPFCEDVVVYAFPKCDPVKDVRTVQCKSGFLQGKVCKTCRYTFTTGRGPGKLLASGLLGPVRILVSQN